MTTHIPEPKRSTKAQTKKPRTLYAKARRMAAKVLTRLSRRFRRKNVPKKSPSHAQR